MMETIKSEMAAFMKPMVAWLQNKGIDFVWAFLGALVIFIIGAILIRMLTCALRNILGRNAGEQGLHKRFIASVVNKSAWVLLGIIVLEKLGVSVTPLIAGLGVTGIVLGFAFQESLGSLAAGIMIAFNNPFKIGDYVIVGGYEGTVKQLDMMAVVLVTGENYKITIPNRQAWGAAIVNYTALGVRRIDIPIGIAYGSDVAKALGLARQTLAALPSALDDPAPMSEVKSLDDSAVVLTCRVWVKSADYWPTYYAANQRLLDAFLKAGIEIPFPQLDVHVVKSS